MEEIYEIIEHWGFLDKKAKFSCFADDIFTYIAVNQDEDTELQLSIITTNTGATFLNKENVKDLILTKDIFFCDVVVYDEDTEERFAEAYYNKPELIDFKLN